MNNTQAADSVADNPFDLTGKVSIVTGCGTGLGQAMAVGLAKAGSDVVGVDLAFDGETEKQIKSFGRRFQAIEADISNVAAIDDVMARAIEAFGKLDILINNAGTNRRSDVLEFTEKDWDDVMNLNIKAVFFFCQSAAKQFIAQKSPGKIINIASVLSFQGGIQVPSYTASKTAVVGLTRLLANEWAKMDININALAPGYMATNMSAGLRKDEVRYKAILDRIPAERWGTPQDLAGPAVFLASKASDYVNGFTLAVDGGWLAR
ncbi:MAG: 2-dehydro-3-deoxy-D-gluconate 5-dehydrogenase KduD [Burkholderiaceae bacterium]|nr:2-dehydro-3-deoxy-D-gluconate 5-dehydrogenase KduD [Burkholderiaceae bacterium]